MVLAGPGSGKTSVIVERTAYMISERKIPPSSVLVVTFSRAAAKEMKERFLDIYRTTVYTCDFWHFSRGVLRHSESRPMGLAAANILTEEEKYRNPERTGSGITEEILAEEGDFTGGYRQGDQCGKRESDFSGTLLFVLLPG